MQEISIKLKADTTLAQRSVQELERKIKNLNDSVKSKKEDGALISNIDIQNFQKMNREFTQFVRNLSQINQQLQQTTQAHRQLLGGGGGDFWDNLQTRFGNQVVGMALGTFSMGNLLNQVRQGMQMIKSEEILSANLGTRIGGYGSDFRRTRLDFTATGNQYNYSALETMRVADAYMSQAGSANIRKNVADILYAAKGLGLDANYLAQVYGSFGHMGTTNLQKFSESIAGAIKRTGMSGREQELIDALQRLTDAAYQNQLSISDQERNNLLGVLSYFGTRESSLKGEKGAQLAGGLDSLLKAGDNEELLIMMGYGSRYKGTQGYWELQQKLARGLTDPSNLRDLMQGLQTWQADPYMKRIWLHEQLKQYGVNNPEMVDFLMRPDVQEDILNGRITKEEIEAIQKGGKTELETRFKNRMQSKTETRSRWDVWLENFQKSLGEVGDALWYSLTDIFTMMSPEVGAGLFAGGALGTSIFGAHLFRKGASSIFRGGGKGGRGTGSLGGFSKILENTKNFFKGLGANISNLLRQPIIPPLPFPEDFLSPSISGSPTAQGNSKLMQTGMTTAFGWGSLNFMHAYGYGSLDSIRTLEARRSDLLTKEMDVLKKKEDLLNKESGSILGKSVSAGELEKVLSRVTDTTRDMMDKYTGMTNSNLMNIMRLSFGALSGGFGSGGLMQVSYGGGSSNGFLTMGLRNGYNMTAEQVNAWIDKYAPKNSVLRGQGAAFVEAARRTGLDVRYLVAHAALETAWGTSNIARTKNNFYGIGAFDSDPYGGAHRWGSVAEGIIGGAEWILKNFTLRGQDTLYEMRHNGGKHEYATDPLWDEKIAKIMAGAPSATININVSGSIDGLTPANNQVVATALANKINNAPDLSYIFTQGTRGVTV